jgi:hypothetical protein
LWTFGAIFHFELNFLTFVQAAVPTTFDGGKMSEYVGATCIRSDKAETFVSVEPLYFTLLSHDLLRPKNKQKYTMNQERRQESTFATVKLTRSRGYIDEALSYNSIAIAESSIPSGHAIFKYLLTPMWYLSVMKQTT